MTTTISPSTGAGVMWTQQGVGTSPGYSAIDMRRADSPGVQEGVMGAGASAQDFMVQQRIAGANMTVDITMPAGGGALVQGDTVSGQGLYYVPVHSANINEAIGSNSSGNPRIDQVILEVLDNVHDASGNNLARTRVVQGTAQAGATLDNRSGAATLPGSALLLADILVVNGAASITNSVIRDRRKWARGAYLSTTIAGGDVSVTGTSYGAGGSLSSTLARVECAGVAVRLTAHARVSSPDAVNLSLAPFFDGSVPSGYDAIAGIGADIASGNLNVGGTYSWTLVPASGSHTFQLAAKIASGTGTISASSTTLLIWTVEEIIRQNTGNNSVTTG